jgi:lysozyme family protein
MPSLVGQEALMTFEDLKDSYAPLWKTARFRSGWKKKADAAAKGVVKGKAQYQAVENATGVPWFVVGLIHQMESDRDFMTHLHNGDPLRARTVNVPAGRPKSGDPPFSWAESAVDALRMQNLESIMAWPLPRIAYELERYNGFSSRTQHHINTPYLWSGTNQYTKGKYVKDHVWSDTAVSKQVGAMAVLRSLTSLDGEIAAALDAPPPEKPDIPAPRPAPGPGTPPVAGRELDLEEVQRRLSTIPLYPPAQIDGDFGTLTQTAIWAFLVQQGVPDGMRWRGQRLVIAGAQALCRLDNIDAGEIDGLLGPQTRYALDVYAGRKSGDAKIETWRDADEDKPPMTPPPINATNWPRQRDVPGYFGERGGDQVKLEFPYPMRIAWAPDQVVRSTSCHRKVRDAAARVLARVREHYGEAKIRELRLDYYGGCLNVRRIRGGSGWSMHSWGIAFDFDPDRNQLRWDHNRAAFAKPVYKKWFEFWEEEGAISLGRARDYDWMHVQFARL